MVALMAYAPGAGTLAVIDVKPALGYLLLQAQRLEAIDVEYYFQLGINTEYFDHVDHNEVTDENI